MLCENGQIYSKKVNVKVMSLVFGVLLKYFNLTLQWRKLNRIVSDQRSNNYAELLCKEIRKKWFSVFFFTQTFYFVNHYHYIFLEC